MTADNTDSVKPRTDRSEASIAAERGIPRWLRDASPEVREFQATVYDQDADEAEQTAATLRERAKALRVYDRRLTLGMDVEPAP